MKTSDVCHHFTKHKHKLNVKFRVYCRADRKFGKNLGKNILWVLIIIY